MQILISVIIIILVIYFIFSYSLSLKGDADINATDDTFIAQCIISDNKATILTTLKLKNKGKQQGLIIDGFARIEPELSKYKGINYTSNVINTLNPRDDGYWEAYILKSQKDMLVKIKCEFLFNDIKPSDALKSFKNIYVDFYYKYYGRSPMNYCRKQVKIDLEHIEFLDCLPSFEIPEIKRSHHPSAITVKTHLLRETDKVIDVIDKYCMKYREEGSILCIAESPLAIMQGRAFYVESIKPGCVAKKFTRLFHADASMSSVYSLQKGVDLVGPFRITMAAIIGTLTKLFGRSGDFYRIAGKQVAVIDDCTGTIPPFDKYIVLGPDKMKETCEDIKAKTGFEVAIVDVNDLKRVDILYSTCPDKKQYITEVLTTNPQGNANEQTPFVVIKPKKNS